MDTIEKDSTHKQEDERRLEVYKSQIRSLSQEDIELFLTQLEQKDLSFKNEPVTLRIAFKIYYDEKELGPAGPQQINIERNSEQCHQKKRLLNELKFRARELDILGKPTVDHEAQETTVHARIERLIQMYSDAYELILYHTRIMERINSPALVPVSLDADGSVFRYSSMTEDDEDKKTPWQNLLL